MKFREIPGFEEGKMCLGPDVYPNRSDRVPLHLHIRLPSLRCSWFDDVLPPEAQQESSCPAAAHEPTKLGSPQQVCQLPRLRSGEAPCSDGSCTSVVGIRRFMSVVAFFQRLARCMRAALHSALVRRRCHSAHVVGRDYSIQPPTCLLEPINR